MNNIKFIIKNILIINLIFIRKEVNIDTIGASEQKFLHAVLEKWIFENFWKHLPTVWESK